MYAVHAHTFTLAANSNLIKLKQCIYIGGKLEFDKKNNTTDGLAVFLIRTKQNLFTHYMQYEFRYALFARF